jgi:NAD(P)-dependent dehydrogenase (short-subunit alcohol dehydrogenase family)
MSRVSRLFDLKDKTAIVTGAASGIGRATAIDFAGAGSKVVVADKSLEGAEGVAREIEADGGTAIAIENDVTSRQSVGQMVERALQEFGKLDILVNNAGILSQTGLLDLKEDELDRTFDVNLKGVLLCSQEVGKHMIERKSGKIINIGSSLSCRASVCNLSGGSADYCASKAAVQALTRSFAMEFGPHGINVNAVAPGPTDTPMHMGYFEMAMTYYEGSVPLGRLAVPEDIADVVLFLATDAARFITGQTIHVNGGQLMVD